MAWKFFLEWSRRGCVASHSSGWLFEDIDKISNNLESRLQANGDSCITRSTPSTPNQDAYSSHDIHNYSVEGAKTAVRR